jgi:diguanylate cyclase (GGDEF)-like protein
VRIGDDRDRIADGRDLRAEASDLVSEARDVRAAARDERAEARERAAGEGGDTGAAADRAGALRDRRGGASDRIQAEDDRKASSTDRGLAALDRAASSLDGMTGAYRREAGFAELAREINRAKRTAQPYTLAFVDLVELKQRNDSLGHAAGDELLRATVGAIRAQLRPYDLIIRYGGDEFLCGLLDVTVAQAAERLSLVNADLVATQQASISVGLAQLETGDAVEDLIARADKAMYTERQHPRPPS